MTKVPTELSGYPLSKYFLSGYLSRNEDLINFPPDMFSACLQNYEKLFAASMDILGIPKESLRAMPEFNFDFADPGNLEAGIAVLRVVWALGEMGFVHIRLVPPDKDGGADIACEKKGHKVCCEVKAITKQSRPREEYDYADAVYEKMLESIGKARSQLDSTARKLGCSIRLFACVMNWPIHPVFLRQNNYHQIVKRLEHDGDQRSLDGIDGVLFVNSGGEKFVFLTEHGKCIGD
jgi:hypothetical protein